MKTHRKLEHQTIQKCCVFWGTTADDKKLRWRTSSLNLYPFTNLIHCMSAMNNKATEIIRTKSVKDEYLLKCRGVTRFVSWSAVLMVTRVLQNLVGVRRSPSLFSTFQQVDDDMPMQDCLGTTYSKLKLCKCSLICFSSRWADWNHI